MAHIACAGSGKKPGSLFLPPTIKLQADKQPPERYTCFHTIVRPAPPSVTALCTITSIMAAGGAARPWCHPPQAHRRIVLTDVSCIDQKPAYACSCAGRPRPAGTGRRLRSPAPAATTSGATGGSGAAPDPARPWPRRRGAAAAPRAPSAAPARAPSTLPAAAARAPTAGEISTHAVLDTSRDMLQEMLSLAHLPLCLPEPLVLSQQVECP